MWGLQLIGWGVINVIIGKSKEYLVSAPISQLQRGNQRIPLGFGLSLGIAWRVGGLSK